MSEGAPCHVTNFAILLTLKVIPEEVENKRVKFTKTKRLECELLVQRAAPHVVQQVLPSIAATIDANEESQGRLRGLLLQCLASWVEFGNVSSSLLLESGLLSRAFHETMVPPFSEDAFVVIREVVRVCKSDSHVPLMIVVMKEFVNLGRRVHEMLVTAPQNVAFCLKNCATAISECGQAFITYFVDYALDSDSRALVFELLETILSFTAINDMETSNETMDFWVDFRAYISGKHEDRMQEFEVFISRLLNILVERTVFPVDFESLSAVAKDQFGVYRNDVRAVFRSLATVSVVSEDRFIIDAIHAIFHQYDLLEKEAQAPSDWWRKTEVYVHALSALSKSIREEDTTIVPRLFELLSRETPASHRALERTIAIFLGVASHWFARNPSFINTFAFPILSRSFVIGENHNAFPFRTRGQEDHVGAVALRKLASRCGQHLFTPLWIDAMLQLYRSNLVAPKVKARLVDGSVTLIVESVALVVASVPYNEALPVVERLCAIMVEELIGRYGGSRLNPEDDDTVAFLCDVLDHLKVLATKIPPKMDQPVPHPMICVLQTHWDLLTTILRAFGSQEDVMDKYCGLLVGLLENVRSDGLELASALMTPLLEHFARSFDGNFLRVIESVVRCAGDDDETLQSLTQVLVIVVETTLSRVASTGNVDDHAGLLVALYALVTTCGTHQPLMLVHCNRLEALMSLMLHSLKAQNPEVGVATLDLLREFGSWYGQVQRIPQDMLQSSELRAKVQLYHLIQTLFFEKDIQYHIVVALFHAAGGAMPPTLNEQVAEVVRSFWSSYGRIRSEELMSRLLSDDAVMATHVPPRTRADFAATICRQDCIDNARKFRRVLTSFCDHFPQVCERDDSA
ncbi:hypothetical protein PINS_up000261 [Pythium insidiosum]|nr:hypothetical protein PINS_up000261 [Pythium insidiosum]